MKKIIIIIAALGMLFSSCSKDFLERSSSNSVPSTTVGASVANLELAMRGIYNNLSLQPRWYSFTFFGVSYYNYFNDIVASSCSQPTESWLYDEWTFSAQVNNSITGDAILSPWDYNYSVIAKINSIVIALEAITPNDGEKKLYYDILGQALASRAFMYQSLNLHYSPRYESDAVAATTLSVPIRKDLSTDAIPRDNQKDVIDFILKDCDDAIAAFSQNSTQLDRRSHYLSLEAAKVLKLRMLMYMSRYDEVVTLSRDIITNTTATIMGKASYTAGFNNIDNTEWIFGTVTSEGYYAEWYNNIMNYAYDYPVEPSVGWTASPRALDLSYLYGMDQSDVNPEEEKYEGQIPNTKGLTMRASDHRYNMFLHDNQEQIEANLEANQRHYSALGWTIEGGVIAQGMFKKFKYMNGSRLADVVMMRLAEVYYIGAEAASLSGDDSQAKAWLSAAVEPYDTGATAENINMRTGKDLRTLIANYKAVDMICEGRILEDVKRRGDWVYRLDKYNAQRQPVSGQYKSKAPYNPTTVDNVLYFPDFTTMPIPAKAIEANRKLEQIKY